MVDQEGLGPWRKLTKIHRFNPPVLGVYGVGDGVHVGRTTILMIDCSTPSQHFE